MGLFDIFSNSDASNAAAAQSQALAAGEQQAQGFIGSGNQNLIQTYQAALSPFNANYAAVAPGQNQLGNLLGLNGANGSATAQNTLQNLPGYQFALNQGAQNVLRNQSATGQLNSGATNVDLQNQGQGVASQNYFNYANQLQPYLGAANNAATGVAGVNTGLGNQLNQNFNTLGQIAYGTEAGIGNAQAQADYANLAASGALWGGILGAGSNIVGAGLKPGGFLGSEPRFKEDIKLDGYHNSGLPIYQFRYRGGKKRYYGVMAPDLEKYCPAAVRGKPGYRNVSKSVVSQILREYGRGRSLG